MLQPEPEEEWRHNLPSRFEFSARPRTVEVLTEGSDSSKESEEEEEEEASPEVPRVFELSQTPRGSRHWRSASCGNIPVEQVPPLPPSLPPSPKRKRRNSFKLRRCKSFASIPTRKKKKKKKKARCLTKIKSKKWRLRNLKTELGKADGLIATRYLSWEKAYCCGRKLGFWKVETNIVTEQEDSRTWVWCVWNTRKGLVAFGNQRKAELVLEAQMLKVLDD